MSIEQLIHGNRIAAASRQPNTLPADGADVVDGGGATLMPGLTEAHSHLSFVAAPGFARVSDIPVEEHLLYTMKAAKLILDHGFTCEYIRGSSFFESLRAAIGDGVPVKEVIQRLEKPMILALSDPMPPVGATSNFQTDALFRLIDSRYRQNKVTFATMNVDNSAEAQKRLSAQIVDRLTHNALTLSFDWQSYRRK